MKRLTIHFTLAALVVAADASAQLATRGPNLVYDKTLNITWLRDANLALTNTFDVPAIDADGSMDWYTAQAFIDALNAAKYLGYSDWRLPRIDPIGEEYDPRPSQDGSTDYSIGVTSPHSELAYMFSVNLRNWNRLVDDPTNRFDESLFANLGCAGTQPFCPSFWSLSTYPDNPWYPTQGRCAVWVFDMSNGWQSGDYCDKRYYAWPVRDGDSKPGGGKKK
jgi:hypothetical protein